MNYFEKLFTKDKSEAVREILNLYNKLWYTFVNYLYFANLISSWLIWKNKENTEFKNTILNGDFLLPDWIALRLLYKKYYKKNIENLNWTDFIIYFLENIKTDYELVLYWSKEETIKKAVENIEKKLNKKVYYFQNWFSDFDFEKVWNLKNSKKIKIFLTWLWTPKQEIWAQNNKEILKKYWFLVFSQWWTFEFWAWTEKRAPKIFRTLKLEWLFRLITNPKKNYKKVLNSLYFFYYYIKK